MTPNISFQRTRKIPRAACCVRHCVEHPAALRALLLSPPSTYDPAVLDRALTRTLPIWNTTGAVYLPGLRRAIEVMVEIGSLSGPLATEALVDLRRLDIGW